VLSTGRPSVAARWQADSPTGRARSRLRPWDGRCLRRAALPYPLRHLPAARRTRRSHRRDRQARASRVFTGR